MARADLGANLIRRVVHGARERTDLHVVCSAQARHLGYDRGRNAETRIAHQERRTNSVREDRHAQIRGAQSSHRIQALREGIHHQRAGAEPDGARGAAEQRVCRPSDVRRVADVRRDRRSDSAHAFLERTGANVPEELVVLDQISSPGGERRRGLCNLARRQAERGLDDRTDEDFVRRSEGRAG